MKAKGTLATRKKLKPSKGLKPVKSLAVPPPKNIMPK